MKRGRSFEAVQESSCRCNQDTGGIAEARVCYVKTSQALDEAAEQLGKARVIGVDIEHNHLRSYRGIVCLVQLHAGSISIQGLFL